VSSVTGQSDISSSFWQSVISDQNRVNWVFSKRQANLILFIFLWDTVQNVGKSAVSKWTTVQCSAREGNKCTHRWLKIKDSR